MNTKQAHRQIKRLYRNGYKPCNIATDLAKQGYVSPRTGKPLSVNGVSSYLCRAGLSGKSKTKARKSKTTATGIDVKAVLQFDASATTKIKILEALYL